MLKIAILIFCLCVSISYYSFLKPKETKDVETAMEILKAIEGNKIDKNSLASLAKSSTITVEVQFDPRTHEFFKIYSLRHRN